MRRAARTDANQEAIVAALRAAGASVQSLAAVGQGVPDLLVGCAGRNWLIECKAQRDDRKKAPARTEDQVKWQKAWRGQCIVVLSPADAVQVLEFLVNNARTITPLHVEQVQGTLVEAAC